MLTVVKMRSSDGPNPLISTSLGKLAVIDRAWCPPGGLAPPANEEFWLVDVVREMHPGRARGAFLVQPRHCVSRVRPDGRLDTPLLYLLPGMYSIALVTPGPALRPVAIVKPDELDGRDWVLSLDAAKIIGSTRNESGDRVYSVVLNLGGEPWTHVRQRRAEDLYGAED